ncbi:AAA family ATPase [Nocardioides sp. B-3]|uniref:AAA family ATPase n=1 Tax=Nocardioides sp. B-3 TaxID=2895565 RepID=UPI0021533ECE|nr:AAA family ATPase [Nocardioides sp. B-3]UUZ60317.1 AAA family ATPase [Nocardioides sp. B-3]
MSRTEDTVRLDPGSGRCARDRHHGALGRPVVAPTRLPLGRGRALGPGGRNAAALGATSPWGTYSSWTKQGCSTGTPPGHCFDWPTKPAPGWPPVGDRHQLPAVGRGGVPDLAIRYAPDRVSELEGVRRFADPAYAELSLRMRTGKKPGEVFDELARRGEIVVHATDVERQQQLTVRATYGDLVVADTREQVGKINDLAHQVREVVGEVTDGVVTASGERIGIGDKIATRRNDHDADVANRETWTVIASDNGAPDRAWGGRPATPAIGLRAAARRALAYATTAYGARGSTVPVSHVLIGDHTGAASAYVGMTRGRDRNVAHPVAESVEDARKQWIDVFGRDRADPGPAHARGLAAEAIDRYGPKAKAPAFRPPAPVRRPEPDVGYRPRAPMSGPGIGF